MASKGRQPRISAPKKRLLTLSTLAPDRPTIVIDGVEYEMIVQQDIDVREYAAIQRLQGRLVEIQGLENPGQDDLDLMISMLDDLMALILPGCPAEVRGRLKVMQKIQIVEVFMQTVPTARAPQASRPKSRTGATSSPDSNASSAETPSAG